MLGVCLKYEQKNYGSKLQALATIHMLEQLQLEYEIIEYNKKTLYQVVRSLPKLLNFVYLNDIYDAIQRKLEFHRHPEIEAKIRVRNEKFSLYDDRFCQHVSKKYSSYIQLKKTCSNRYHKVLTCSDQLWSPSALCSGFYNLMFVPDDIQKVSWASSFGVSKIPWYQKRRTKKYLDRIQHISMRENRGAEIVQELTGRRVPVLMDPVFVFDKAQWEQLVPPQPPEWEPYIFCYFLGDNAKHRAAARELAKKSGLKIVTLRHLDRYIKDDEQFGDFAPYDVDPDRFLNILRNATYVCTDSFHGTAFSLICQKQFIVFNRYNNKSGNSKNSRIDSVCCNLGVEDRRYCAEKDILQAMTQSIDYNSINQKIDVYRETTKDFLMCLFEEKC